MHESASVKNMHIRDLRVTESVPVGGSFTATVSISNGAFVRHDDDRCTGPNGCSFRVCGASTCINTIFGFAGGEFVNGPFCLCGAIHGERTRDFSATFVAPSTPGTYELSATLELPGSGSTAGPLTSFVTVTETDTGDPNGGNGNGSNGNGNDNGTDNGTGGSGGLAFASWVAVGGIAAAVVLGE